MVQPQPLPTDVGQRARSMRTRVNDYTREFVFQTLHQMLLARIPLDAIAQRFQVHPCTVIEWRKQLYARLKAEAKGLDAQTLIGESIAQLRQLRSQGWQMILGSKASAVDKRAGAHIVLGAERELMTLLERCGMFEKPLLGLSETVTKDQAAENANALVELSKGFLSGVFADGEDPDAANTILSEDGLPEDELEGDPGVLLL